MKTLLRSSLLALFAIAAVAGISTQASTKFILSGACTCKPSTSTSTTLR